MFRIIYDFFNHLDTVESKKLSEALCNVANNIPYSFADRHFLGVLTYILKKTPNCLIVGEASGYGEYVVLDERECGVCYLGGEVSGLAFSEAKVLLTVLEDHLNRPSHGIYPIGPVEVNGTVCGDDAIPWGTAGGAHIEESYSCAVHKRIHHDVVAAMEPAVFERALFILISGDQGLGGELLPLAVTLKRETHGPLSHPYHTKIMTGDTACGDETQDLPACKPTVREQIVKPVTVFYGPVDHLLEKGYLAFCIVLNAFGGLCVLASPFLLIPSGQLLLRHGVAVVLSGLAYELMVYDHLASSVAYRKDKSLEAKYHPVGDMAEHAPDFFCVYASLGLVCVIHDHADWKSSVVGTVIDLSPELAGNVVQYPAPVEIVVVHKTVENVLAGATYPDQS